MRKWLASKLFAWAVWLDWEEAAQAARIIVAIDDSWKAALAPPKKRGRPFGGEGWRGREEAWSPVWQQE